ncbi:hypothetical protein BVC80_1825g31 [Macleaya cordata]|uniref:BRI1 kinase inhibitor 1 n=1 Tax=Macleaya cordata TaxID=56857 RepID=A0A200QZA8_MACCD|nr:hypothetical protein BVC80_1825g31 [Macleaya cordata]
MNNNIPNQQKKRESTEGGGGERSSSKQQGKESQSTTTTKQQLPTITSSPPSSTTSPSHEFSFTISLHSSSAVPEKTKTPTPPSFAIDLSPADDIFFHGHLLPLHLLSHLPISPRSSTNSLDSFTLPIRELVDDDQKPNNTTTTNTTTTTHNNNIHNSYTRENRGRIKAKSFSFLKFPRWRKGSEIGEREKEMEREEEERKKKVGSSISQILRRYAKMVRPLLFYKGGRKETGNLHRQPYSFSGNLSLKGNNKQELRGRRGEFSAPASMWTSPTNSGLLLTTPSAIHSSTSESSMEELQSAIQAAIAHCKNSIAMKEEKLQC